VNLLSVIEHSLARNGYTPVDPDFFDTTRKVSEEMDESPLGDIFGGDAGDEYGVGLYRLGMGGVGEMLSAFNNEVRHLLSYIVAYPCCSWLASGCKRRAVTEGLPVITYARMT